MSNWDVNLFYWYNWLKVTFDDLTFDIIPWLSFVFPKRNFRSFNSFREHFLSETEFEKMY